MRTPLRRGLDDEIFEVEARIAERREVLPHVARRTGRSALDALVSPAGLAAAVALGFIAGGGLRRRRRARKVKVVRTEEKSGFALGSLLMSGALALIKAQYGSPAGMAQALLSKLPLRKEEKPLAIEAQVERRSAPTVAP